MDNKWYRRTTLEQMERMQFRTKRTLRNGMMEIPPGTVVRVDGKHGGLSLIADPCGTCGIKVSINRVQPSDIDVVTAGATLDGHD